MKANILAALRALNNDESGQDLVEYALIASLIALGSVTAMTSLATSINNVYSTVTTILSAA